MYLSSSLCYRVGYYWLCILLTVVCMCQNQCPSLFLFPITTSLFSTSVILLLFCNQVHLYIFFKVPHISSIIYLPFPDLLHSIWQSVGPSRLLKMTLFSILSASQKYLFIEWNPGFAFNFFPLLFVIETYRERFINMLSQYKYWLRNHGPLTDLVIF